MTRISPEGVALLKMWFEIQNETDRGAAILAHACLDDRLKDAIMSKFYRQGATAEELLRPSGYLGQYAARCKIGYCLGLFGKTALRDLDTIGQIRNKFAHSKDIIRFSDNAIKKLCDALDDYAMGIDEPTVKDPRERYLRAAETIGLFLMGETYRKDQPTPLPPRFSS